MAAAAAVPAALPSEEVMAVEEEEGERVGAVTYRYWVRIFEMR